ncbi:SDR family oxidoreductase [Aquabacterium lacunae]|uniref:SDR family oxidoreductase n=1 Tax=Aquabacterium lacunae TaxID=2528630 RepID=A0A4Q9GXJ2_9BURK|nr:SDR family oxidoreductase [Aquabacterium lacunae]TBO30116.1 SDR family oxidoreductase [Aquabacterium lacunae]
MTALAAPPGTVAVVTGHSRGLGLALAHALLALGVPVLGLARQACPEHVTLHAPGAPNVPGATGAQVARLQQEALDLADPNALADWLATGTLVRFMAGASQVLLLNNAGTVQPMGAPGLQGAEAIAQAVALNVSAPLMLCDALLQHRAPGQPVRVVHIGSGAGRTAYAGWSVYGATKAALDHHARCVQADALPGVRAESLAPGVLDTDMQADIRATRTERFPLRARFDQLHASGALVPPEQAARHLLAHVLSEAFGQHPCTDLRNLPAPT